MCLFTISISTATLRASHVHLCWMTKGHWTLKFVRGNCILASLPLKQPLISPHQTSSRILLLPWQQHTCKIPYVYRCHLSHLHKRFIFIIQMYLFSEPFKQQKSFWTVWFWWISSFIFLWIFKCINMSLYSVVSGFILVNWLVRWFILINYFK